MIKQSISCRSGFSLLEVLVSVFVVLIGLLGVATMIPAGRYEMTEARNADMGANLSRALLRSVITQINTDWTPTDLSYYITFKGDASPSSVLVANALGKAPLAEYTGNFNNNPVLKGNNDLYWTLNDDKLVQLWSQPDAGGDAVNSGNAAFNVAQVMGTGAYTAFATIIPQGNGFYEVTAGVVYRIAPDDDKTFAVTSQGGGTFTVVGEELPERGQYVLLYGDNNSPHWYRVENIYGGFITLQGPEWFGGGNATMLVPGKVVSVSTRTLRLGR